MKTKLPPSANSEQEEEILDLNTIVTNVNQVSVTLTLKRKC